MRPVVLMILAACLTLGAFACASQMVVKDVPDALVEDPPPPPNPDHNFTWVPGYWTWDDGPDRYTWNRGHWETTPPGCQWVDGHYRWEDRHNMRVQTWVAGRWDQP